MRCGQSLGTLDCETNIIPMLGASNTPPNKEMLKLMKQGKGVSGDRKYSNDD